MPSAGSTFRQWITGPVVTLAPNSSVNYRHGCLCYPPSNRAPCMAMLTLKQKSTPQHAHPLQDNLGLKPARAHKHANSRIPHFAACRMDQNRRSIGDNDCGISLATPWSVARSLASFASPSSQQQVVHAPSTQLSTPRPAVFAESVPVDIVKRCQPRIGHISDENCSLRRKHAGSPINVSDAESSTKRPNDWTVG